MNTLLDFTYEAFCETCQRVSEHVGGTCARCQGKGPLGQPVSQHQRQPPSPSPVPEQPRSANGPSKDDNTRSGRKPCDLPVAHDGEVGPEAAGTRVGAGEPRAVGDLARSGKGFGISAHCEAARGLAGRSESGSE